MILVHFTMLLVYLIFYLVLMSIGGKLALYTLNAFLMVILVRLMVFQIFVLFSSFWNLDHEKLDVKWISALFIFDSVLPSTFPNSETFFGAQFWQIFTDFWLSWRLTSQSISKYCKFSQTSTFSVYNFDRFSSTLRNFFRLRPISWRFDIFDNFQSEFSGYLQIP